VKLSLYRLAITVLAPPLVLAVVACSAILPTPKPPRKLAWAGTISTKGLLLASKSCEIYSFWLLLWSESTAEDNTAAANCADEANQVITQVIHF
jgi:hypothetical protein